MAAAISVGWVTITNAESGRSAPRSGKKPVPFTAESEVMGKTVVLRVTTTRMSCVFGGKTAW